jgi:tetratricopeptide (TPR) repeat protein
MKNQKKRSALKNHSLVYVIISFIILLPLLNFVSFSFAKNPDKNDVKLNSSTNQLMPPDSMKIKLQAAIELAIKSPTEDSYINLSYYYYMNALYNECVTASQKALEYNAKSCSAYNNECCAYNQLGAWSKAISAGKKALEITAGDPLATNNLAVSMNGKAKQEKDITAAETLVKANPSETNYLSLGYLYYMAGSYDLSINIYKKVIEINKKSVTAYNNICSAYNELGKYKEAMVYCETALKIDSTFLLSKNNLKFAEDKLKP